MWSNGHSFWDVTTMIVYWVAIGALVYLAFRGSVRRAARPSAQEILDERLASGELSEEEYDRKCAALAREHREVAADGDGT